MFCHIFSLIVRYTLDRWVIIITFVYPTHATVTVRLTPPFMTRQIVTIRKTTYTANTPLKGHNGLPKCVENAGDTLNKCATMTIL